MKSLLRSLTVIIILSSFASVVNAAADIAGVYSPDGSQIAFVSDREGGYEIYIIDSDGANPRNLSFNKGQDLWPSWSPDGTTIAYSHGAGSRGKRYVYLINADGTGKMRLAEGNAPSFSPDGNKLIFTKYTSDENKATTLHMMDLANKKISTITYKNELALKSAPSFSGDGKSLVMIQQESLNEPSSIITMNLDGTSVNTIFESLGRVSDTKWSSDNQLILFANRALGNTQVYLMTPSGGNLKAITFGDSDNRYPRFSGDNKKVIFTSNRSGGTGFGGDLYSLTLKTGAIERITRRNLDNRNPSMSNNGYLVFTSTRDENKELYIQKNEKTRPERLTFSQSTEESPEISNNGRSIVYVKRSGNANDIYVFDLISGKTTNITRSEADEKFPRWSDDGTRIIYEANEKKLPNIFSINMDGTKKIQITNDAHWQYKPHWNKARTQIIYSSYKNGNWDIFKIDTNSGFETQLTKNESSDFDASFSPNGELIAFTSDRNKRKDSIFVMNSDGTNQKALTALEAATESPKWSADGKRVLFEAEVKGQRLLYSVDIEGGEAIRLAQ